jgi:phosphatidylglycerophosphate synthase
LSPRPLLVDTGWRLAFLGAALAIAALLLTRVTGLGWRAVTGTLAAYGAITLLVLMGLSQHAPHPRFGPANALTLTRAAYVALLLGVTAESVVIAPAGRWLLVAAGMIALVLDGLDGHWARKSGLASSFGARFDMEVDALFVLALSALVWRAGQAGIWVLASGFMRYCFVIASWVWPALAAPLPPSFRRKTICVLQLVALLLALAPPVGSGAATLLCLAGLLLLGYSFALDCLSLLVSPRQRQGAEGMTT